MIEVFNSRDLDELEDVLTNGLRSKETLIREGKLDPEELLHEFERWRHKLIYFSLDEPSSGTSWFSVLVDPLSALVGNESLECCYQLYRKSIMPLPIYLERKKTLKKFSHPITAIGCDEVERIPATSTREQLRGKISDYSVCGYAHEVFLEVPVIKVFHRFYKGAT